MRKASCALLTIALLAGPGMAMALPPVTLSSGCSYVTAIDTQADQLLGLLSGLIDDLPDYIGVDGVDLEQAMMGDGIPDNYEMALLGAALCSGSADSDGLRAQFAANKAAYLELNDKLVEVVDILLGPSGTTGQSAADRLAAAADIFEAAGLGATPEGAELIATLDGVATQLNDLLADVDPMIILVVRNALSQGTLALFGDFAAAVVGLSTEMQATVTDLLADYQADIETYVGQAQALVTAAQGLIDTYDFGTENEVALQSLVDDAGTLIADVNWVLDLPSALSIYGGAKSATEPFSAAGDYDGDGTTNGAVFTAVVTENEGTRADFVAAASGANTLYPGNAGMPVAGLVGLAFLASSIALGGTLVIRKK